MYYTTFASCAALLTDFQHVALVRETVTTKSQICAAVILVLTCRFVAYNKPHIQQDGSII